MSDLASDATGHSGPAAPPGRRADEESSGRGLPRPGVLATLALVALPAALTLYLSFNAGGFFAGTHGLVATALGIMLVLRITLAEAPFAGLTRPLAIALGALGLFAAWILLSAGWSDAPARALVEFDRALMYWLALLLLGSVRWTPAQLAWAIRAVALAMAIVACVALATRVLPDVFPTVTPVDNKRLGHPLGYWNALGIFCGLGTILCVHLTSSLREPLAVRAAAAGALPLLVGALFFSFSRGGMVVAALGIVLYAVVARPRGSVGALTAAGPAVAVTLALAYRADELAGDDPTSAAAVARGEELALALGAIVVVAVLARLACARIDRAMERLAPRRGGWSPRSRWALGAAAAVVLVVVAVAGGGQWVGDRFDSLATADAPESGDLRTRLSSASTNGRLDQWRVALDAFRADPLVGSGAGTYARTWARERDTDLKVEDGHSLYLETLAELGAVGLALVVATLLALIVGVALRARGPDRAVPAAILACLVAWALHAGIDWDWEMPAVTVAVLALGAMALTGRRAGERGMPLESPGRLPRVVLGLACLMLIVVPSLMALSQDRLDRSVEALRDDDCDRAIALAVDAIDMMPLRPEPFAVLGYCDSRIGKDELAVQALEVAVSRDPGDWQLRYGLALVRAAAGEDPRPAARAALRLNPREPLARHAVERFRGTSPDAWRRQARTAPLPIL